MAVWVVRNTQWPRVLRNFDRRRFRPWATNHSKLRSIYLSFHGYISPATSHRNSRFIRHSKANFSETLVKLKYSFNCTSRRAWRCVVLHSRDWPIFRAFVPVVTKIVFVLKPEFLNRKQKIPNHCPDFYMSRRKIIKIKIWIKIRIKISQAAWICN